MRGRPTTSAHDTAMRNSASAYPPMPAVVKIAPARLCPTGPAQLSTAARGRYDDSASKRSSETPPVRMPATGFFHFAAATALLPFRPIRLLRGAAGALRRS